METTPTTDELTTPKRPSVLRLSIPFFITAGILYWVFSSVDVDQLKEIFSTIPLWTCLIAMGGATFTILICDIASFGNSYRWFLTKSATWWDIICVRSSIFLLIATFSPLAPILPLGYFFKRWKIPIFKTFTMGLFVIFLDGYGGSTLIAFAFLTADEPIAWYWQAIIAAHWLFLGFVLLYYFTNLKDRLPTHSTLQAVFFTFRQAEFKQYLFVYGVRLALIVGQVIAVQILLDTLNIHLKLWQLLIFVPFFYGSAMLPISAGGYGGPQGAAILFLVEMWNVTNTETALVFSLVWSTLFLFWRVVIGVTFLLPLWKRLQLPHNEPLPAILLSK